MYKIYAIWMYRHESWQTATLFAQVANSASVHIVIRKKHLYPNSNSIDFDGFTVKNLKQHAVLQRSLAPQKLSRKGTSGPSDSRQLFCKHESMT